jgi:hypothetical protein
LRVLARFLSRKAASQHLPLHSGRRIVLEEADGKRPFFVRTLPRHLQQPDDPISIL